MKKQFVTLLASLLLCAAVSGCWLPDPNTFKVLLRNDGQMSITGAHVLPAVTGEWTANVLPISALRTGQYIELPQTFVKGRYDLFLRFDADLDGDGWPDTATLIAPDGSGAMDTSGLNDVYVTWHGALTPGGGSGTGYLWGVDIPDGYIYVTP